MVDEFLHRRVVAHHKAVELPFVAQHTGQRERIRRSRHAVEIIEGAHECADAGVERGLERWKIDVAQVCVRKYRWCCSRGRLRPRRSRPSVWRTRRLCRRRCSRGPGIRAHARAAITAPRNGSSPAPSTIRPQRGSRAMSTIGANVQCTPAADASAAATLAALSAATGSKLAASPSGTGKIVR